MDTSTTSSNTGSYLAISGLIVAALSRFGLIVSPAEVVQVIAGIVTLYGIIHQYYDKKKVVAAAKAAGAPIR